MTNADRDLFVQFFFSFAKAEYALKNAGYYQKRSTDAMPDWARFAKDFEGQFDLARVSQAQYLLSSPPRKQVIENGALDWKDTPRCNEGDLNWLLILVRRVRNNLFHGGKMTSQVPDEEHLRRRKLVKASLAVLDDAMRLDANIARFFSDDAG
jgi:hypothetical protein